MNQGLRAHGFGQTLLLPWPGGTAELDDRIRSEAIDAGATGLEACVDGLGKVLGREWHKDTVYAVAEST